MKPFVLAIFLTTFSFSGFFDASDEANEAKAVYAENDRLCKSFNQKVEIYKKEIEKFKQDKEQYHIAVSEDELILKQASMASYEHRASIFCKKAQEAKQSLNP
ncbi:MAG: hypothetical protein RLZZ428_1177 [Pseudomonadota bacterium]|jgi:hypothetical protein